MTITLPFQSRWANRLALVIPLAVTGLLHFLVGAAIVYHNDQAGVQRAREEADALVASNRAEADARIQEALFNARLTYQRALELLNAAAAAAQPMPSPDAQQAPSQPAEVPNKPVEL